MPLEQCRISDSYDIELFLLPETVLLKRAILHLL